MEKLYKNHCHNYLITPDLDVFIEQKILIKISDRYQLNLDEAHFHFWSNLKDKISMYLWELLCDDQGYEDDKLRIRRFLALQFREEYSLPLNWVSNHSKNRFLNAAIELILFETDLDGVEFEFDKVRLDNTASILPFHKTHLLQKEEFLLETADVFSLYKSLHAWQEKAQTTYLFGQDSRRPAHYLLLSIINCEPEHSLDGLQFKRILGLVRAGLNKPYILWYVGQFIIRYQPSVIPYLFMQTDLCSFGFELLDTMEVHQSTAAQAVCKNRLN